MAEGGNGFLSEQKASSENVPGILSEKSLSSTSSDSEIGLTLDGVSENIPGTGSAPPPAPPLAIAAAAAACAAVAGEINGLDRLLQKQRNDRMFELRKLQHGERPVSNSDKRGKLEKFFAHSSEPIHETERHQQPDSIRLEVSGLFEQRPVSSVLQSATFRRNLEGVIRGTVIRQERELQTAIRLQSAGLQVQQRAPIVYDGGAGDPSHHSETLSQGSYISRSSGHSGEQQWPIPPTPPPPQMSPGVPQLPWQQNNPWQQQQQQAWSQSQNMAMQSPPWQQPPWQQPSWQQPPWQQPPPSWQQPPWQQMPPSWQRPPWQQPPQAWQRPPWQQPSQSQQRLPGQQRPQQQQAQVPPVLHQPPWLSQRSSQPQPGQEQPQNILAQVQQEQRESIVSEISNLVQRQLVSNTLESNFRGRLEIAMADRLSHQESNGVAVAELVRSLPTNPAHQRNDFSHLGIQSPAHQLSANPGAVDMSMTWGGADFDGLRRQMDELQNMVRLSFDLQLDMQRAIRQEVSAALVCRQSGDDTNTTDETTSQPGTRAASEGSCLICLDKTVDTVLYQCGHMCVCLSCGMRLKGMGAHCPMCRAPIRDVIRAFRCQQPE